MPFEIVTGPDLKLKVDKVYPLPPIATQDHGGQSDQDLAAQHFQRSLESANEQGLGSVAFSLDTGGSSDQQSKMLVKIATELILGFLNSHDLTVYLLLANESDMVTDSNLIEGASKYLDRHYQPDLFSGEIHLEKALSLNVRESEFPFEHKSYSQSEARPKRKKGPLREKRLEDLVLQLEATFSERLLQMIDERGFSDVEVYKRANLDRKLFSKIRSDKHYQPSKPTVMAFCISLRLDLDTSKNLLATSGYALSKSSMLDMLFEYYMTLGAYNVFEFNELLFHYKLPTLGTKLSLDK